MAFSEGLVGDGSALFLAGGGSLTKTTTTLDQYQDASVDLVVFLLTVNVLSFAGCLLLFITGLAKTASARFLAPRLAPDVDRLSVPQLFREVWHESGPSEKMSLDGTVMVRFCMLGFRFCAWGSLSSLFLIPVYATGDAAADGFNVYSLSNVSVGSDRFWCAIISAYVLLAFFADLVISEWESFVDLRRNHLIHRAQGSFGLVEAQASRTLLVEMEPGKENAESEVKAFFDQVFGEGAVYSFVLQKDTAALHRLLGLDKAMRSACCGCCQPLTTEPLQQPGRQVVAPARQGTASAGLVQAAAGLPTLAVDGAGEMRERVRELGTGVQQLTFVRAQGMCARWSSTAFVTFRSIKDRVVAEQIGLAHRHKERWSLKGAPACNDILWFNASKTVQELRIRSWSSTALKSFGLMFWSLPVASIQAWSSVDRLKKWFPAMGDLARHAPVTDAFLNSFLPVLSLILLLTVLPYTFESIAKRYECIKTKSDVSRSVLNTNFRYQLATLYVTVLSSSLWKSLESILEKPEMALTLLREMVPNVAVYFMGFVLVRVGLTLPMYLLRPWDIFYLRNTSTMPPVWCMFGTEAVSAGLVFTLGLTYSFIAPCMLPVCAIYFGIATLTYKWLFMYVYTPQYDCAGAFWYDLFDGAMLGLFLGTFTLLAIASVYADYRSPPFLLCVPLPILVAWLYFHCKSTYEVPSYHVSLEDAVAVDVLTPSLFRNFDRNAYVDPILELNDTFASVSLETADGFA